jgi:hypothetical protein
MSARPRPAISKRRGRGPAQARLYAVLFGIGRVVLSEKEFVAGPSDRFECLVMMVYIKTKIRFAAEPEFLYRNASPIFYRRQKCFR